MGIKSDQLAVQEFEMVAEFKGDMVGDSLKAQDEDTQLAIMAVYKVLCDHATAEVKAGTSMVAPGQALIKTSLLWLSHEIVKDMAVLGIRVANYRFDPGTCVSCAAEM